MKILSKNIQNKGFIYKQIKREGDKAIYEQTKKGFKFKNYEVVKISRHNGYEIGGQYIAPAETYPGASQWGVNGWTFSDLKDAEKKFKTLK
jgi:hypothetical protein